MRENALTSKPSSEMARQFPGLAVPNRKAVSLDEDFSEYDPKKAPPPPPPSAVGESSRRRQSNLPSWMTQDQDDDGNPNPSAPKRKRGEDPPPSNASSSSNPAAITLHKIYDGTVTKLMDFGVFVAIQLPGAPPNSASQPPDKKNEGLVHISQLQNAIVNKAEEVVRKNQRVKVKVISMAGSRVSLSMKEVDQKTGKDLFPFRQQAGDDLAPSQASMKARTMNRGVDVEQLKRRQEEVRLSEETCALVSTYMFLTTRTPIPLRLASFVASLVAGGGPWKPPLQEAAHRARAL